MIQRKSKKPWVLFIIPFVFVGLFYFKKNTKATESDEIKSLNLSIKGKIVNVVKLDYGHNYGILRLILFESNIDFYDERNSLDKFFGVVKGNKAEIIINGINGIKEKDIFILKGDEYQIFRNEKLIRDEYLTYLSSGGVFNPYREVKNRLEL